MQLLSSQSNDKKEPKVCCFTGHREIPEDKRDYVTIEIEKAVMKAVNSGYDYFISGFANGTDLEFSNSVINYRLTHDIKLEAAIPWEGWLKKKDQYFQSLLIRCNVIHTCFQEYNKACYLRRNDYMLSQSSLVIGVYDGRMNGGTYYTLKRAKKLNIGVFYKIEI